LGKQISILGIWNFGKAKLNFIFPIFVYVKSAVEIAHVQGRDTERMRTKRKSHVEINVQFSFTLSDVNKNGYG